MWGYQNCEEKVDTAGDIFKHLLPNVIEGFELKDRTNDWEDKGVLRFFSQNEFLDYVIGDYVGFYDYGYIYYPNTCFEKTDTDE